MMGYEAHNAGFETGEKERFFSFGEEKNKNKRWTAGGK